MPAAELPRAVLAKAKGQTVLASAVATRPGRALDVSEFTVMCHLVHHSQARVNNRTAQPQAPLRSQVKGVSALTEAVIVSQPSSRSRARTDCQAYQP